MSGFIEIAMYVLLPLAWGMAVALVFERIRRSRSPRRNSAVEGDRPE